MSVLSSLIISFQPAELRLHKSICDYFGLTDLGNDGYIDLASTQCKLGAKMLTELNGSPLDNGFRPQDLLYYYCPTMLYYDDAHGEHIVRLNFFIDVTGYGDFELTNVDIGQIHSPLLTAFVNAMSSEGFSHMIWFVCNHSLEACGEKL